jgi:hypothetical protein
VEAANMEGRIISVNSGCIVRVEGNKCGLPVSKIHEKSV